MRRFNTSIRTHPQTPGIRFRISARAIQALAVVAALASAGAISAQAHAAGCPNEALRAENGSSGLPDCRAYELVTSRSTFGEPVFTPFGVDGPVFAYETLGSDSGDNAETTGGAYLARRSPAGWVDESIEASAEAFQAPPPGNGQAVEDLSGDSSHALVYRAPLGAKPIDRRFYLNAPNQNTVEVGPTVPPTAVEAWGRSAAEEGELPKITYVGGSPDLSQVLFSSQSAEGGFSFRWPDDTTRGGFSMLYEDVSPGAGETPRRPVLVGVTDAGALVSQCGVVLGASEPTHTRGESADTYGAVSWPRGGSAEPDVTAEEGTKIFFTAIHGPCTEPLGSFGGAGPPVDELFARVDGARTVAISEPSHEDCSECDVSEARSGLGQEEVEALGATFQGASRDGARVFFLSQQRLLPGSNGVNLYEYDFNGPPGRRVSLIATKMATATGTLEETESSPRAGVVRLAPNGERIYFVSHAVLAANKGASGLQAEAGSDNLYVYDTTTARYTFVARLAPADGPMWKAKDSQRQAETTPDGAFLLFGSHAALTADAPTDGTLQLYRYDVTVGEADARAEEQSLPAAGQSLIRVTAGSSTPETERAAVTSIAETSHRLTDFAAPEADSMSEDGQTIAFSSSGALTPHALDNVCALGAVEEAEGKCQTQGWALNVYEYKDGHVYLISDGLDRHAVFNGAAARLIGLTPNGDDILFQSADPLVPADTDTQVDIYDARVDGGFPALPSARCGGEGCTGATSAAPVFAAPGSLGAGGEGLPGGAPNLASRSAAASLHASGAWLGTRARLNVRVSAAGELEIRGRSFAVRRLRFAKAGTYTVYLRMNDATARRLRRSTSSAATLELSYRTDSGAGAHLRLRLSHGQTRRSR
jgi:hypothetical protein